MLFQMTDRGRFRLIVLTGVLGAKDVSQCVQRWERHHAVHGAAQSWLIDVTNIEEFQIGLYDMNIVAQRCNSANHLQPIRCAIVVRTLAQIGFARIIRMLIDHPSCKIRLVWSAREALRWLSDDRSSQTRSANVDPF